MRSRVAVIGGGITGIAAAWCLRSEADVTLFESADRLGGHAHPVPLAFTPDRGWSIARLDRPEQVIDRWVDTAFLVFHSKTYPEFLRLLRELGVGQEPHPSRMSLDLRSTADSSGLHLGRPTWPVLQAWLRGKRPPLMETISTFRELGRFRARLHGFEDPANESENLTEWLEREKFSPEFINGFVLPLGAAVWTTPTTEIARMPARAFTGYYRHHGYLSARAEGHWLSFPNSSHAYLAAAQKAFGSRLSLSSPVERIEECETGVTITFSDSVGNRRTEPYDAVILATHADRAAHLLRSANPLISQYLLEMSHLDTQITLHTDISVMNRERGLWASWNVVGRGRGAQVSYYLNQIAGIPEDRDPLFVTMGSTAQIAEKKVLARYSFRHPLWNGAGMSARQGLAATQQDQSGPCFVAGSYFGYGFHEDGARAGRVVAEACANWLKS